MIRQYELVESVKAYDPRANEDALNRAYVFAMKAHGAQKRASGDPYFSHPLEVAGILTQFKLDSASIVTALLHDTIEDTEVTADEIEDHFGDEVSRLVQGVTKLTQIEMQSDGANQAENFRKLVLAMSEDIRVLIVKLADRLHNMRTLRFIASPEKRRQIALETMEIYAPLAERIGFEEIKSELEDLSFAELNPEGRDSILRRLKFLREEGTDRVTRITDQLRQTLAKEKIRAQVIGREKQPYSIWKKTQRKDVAFEQLSDIVAFRVIVNQVEDCYRALGVIHQAYSVVPGRFKDYISTPKPNGYKSIHTAVIGPERQRVEIQIRTREMHEVAELGVAAHWRYKLESDNVAGRQYRWMRELLDILDQAAGPEDFLEHTKLEMFANQVFCFTPKGDSITLPEGATPVDFAYAVHSEIGDTCVGCKINGKIMPLRTELRNGDQVEIITSKAQTPSPMWENFVATGKARARIRRFIRQRERAEYVSLGVAILQNAFADAGYEATDKALEQAAQKFNIPTVDDLKAEVGAGQFTGLEVVEAVYPETKKSRDGRSFFRFGLRAGKARPKGKGKHKGTKGGKDVVPIKGLIPGMAVHFAICCHPLPGDRIVGIVTKGRGVTIHTIDCESLEDFADMPERWLDVAWDADAAEPEFRVGRLLVTVTNEPGSLGACSTVIAKNGGNISNLKIVDRAVQFFDLAIDIEVQDLKHLTNIIGALRASPAIIAVERARG